MQDKFLVLVCTLVLVAPAWTNNVEMLKAMKNYSPANGQVSEEVNELVDNILDKVSEEMYSSNAAKMLSASASNADTPTGNIWLPESQAIYENRQAADIVLQAYKELDYQNASLARALKSGEYSAQIAPSYCPPRRPYACNPYDKYRTLDGSCNNLEHPSWAEARTPLERLAAPTYDDGIEQPRTSSVIPGSYLPNARTLAIEVFRPQQSVSDWSHFMTFFGQFVAHDTSLTEQVGQRDGYRKHCPCGTSDPDCFNIPVPRSDYVNKDQSCLTFVRSSPALNCGHCYVGPREQVNGQTGYVDLSHVYGTTRDLSRLLRSYVGGRLKVQTNKQGKDLLPPLPGSDCNYDVRANGEYSRRPKCYMVGDYRAEDNVFLTSLHTIFVRDHNNLAKALAKINPHWSDELLFQETRRILTAVYQNIVYNEYVPALLGKELARSFDLVSRKANYGFQYDPTLNAQTFNEFATAAFRYGHALTTQMQLSAGKDYKATQRPVHFYFFNNKYYESHLEDAIRGSLMSSSYYPRSQAATDLNDWLFNGLFYKEGKRSSLPALNIQRGRDHGLGTYNTYRKMCGLKPAYSFRDYTNVPDYLVKVWRSLYPSYEDVDLFVGIFGEYPLEGSVFGPTGACLIAKQFYEWKFGDRWWFENPDPSVRFTDKQLSSIKTVTMAKVLCSTLELKTIQKFAFFTANYDWNPLVDCCSVPGIDLNLWRDYGYSQQQQYGPQQPQSYARSYQQVYSQPESYPESYAEPYSEPKAYPQAEPYAEKQAY